MKFAKIAIAGLPNAGKSTFLNKIIGSYIAPTCHKRNTTRKQMQYIFTEGDIQIDFYDIPGFTFEYKSMNKISRLVVNQVDFTLVIIDLSSPINHFEDKLLNMCSNSKIIIILNKLDIMKYPEKIDFYRAKYNHVLVTSMKKGKLSHIKEYIFNLIEDREWEYDPNDDGIKIPEWSCEVTRKFILERFHQEVPYFIDVKINSYEEKENDIIIHQDIIVVRKAYKYILLGDKGLIMKSISQKSRKIISDYAKKNVHLFLLVKVDSCCYI